MNLAKLNDLLAYANPYADSLPMRPPVGFPADFIDPAYIAANAFWLEADMEARIRRDTAPLPHPDNREGYNGDFHLGYWLCGYRDYRRTLSICEKYGLDPRRVFDFGCSTARILRHFHFQHGSETWGCDFKISSTTWNLTHLPTSMVVFQNDYFPRLPAEDNFFDLVTAYSVFTHLDETETGWLLELRRVLRPGGLAYLSIHDEETWTIMNGDLRRTVEEHREDIAALPALPPGKTVVTFRRDDPYRCNVFHARDHIQRVWARYFEILEVIPRQLDQQAVVVCRKR